MKLNTDLSAEIPATFGALPVYIELIELYQHHYQLPLHWHATPAFVVAMTAPITVTVEMTTFQVARGQAVLVNARRMHTVAAPAGTAARVAVIAVDPGLLMQASSDTRQLLQSRLGPSGGRALLLTAAVTWQDAVLRRLSRLVNHYRFGGATPLTTYTEALAVCARVLPHLPTDQVACEQTQLVAMMQYIEAHYAEPLTAAEIAQQAQISRSQCFALFAAAAETTPLGYVTRRRMQVAAGLLANSELSIAEIAQQVGYKTASHFGQQFKRYVGRTPRSYRLERRISET